jgi:hypothetical protein
MTNWNATATVFGLAVSIFLGHFITAMFLPARFASLRIALAPGVGAGVCSFIYLLFRRPFLTIELALLLTVPFFLWSRRKQIGLAGLHVKSWPGGVLSIILPALTLACSSFVIRINRMPHGSWDGWAIWNWEARLLYRAGSRWKDYLPFAFHGDYPLLVPSTTARLWRYAGTEVPEAGALLGVLLALCSIAVLGLTLSELRDSRLGTLMALVLTGTPMYLDYATSQYADVPISFFFVSTIALIAIHFEREPEQMRILALGGFLAGCAGWTKNEGLLLIIATGTAFLLPALHESSQRLRRFGAFCTGVAAPLGVILFFKLNINVRNDLVTNQHNTLQKIFDIGRHTTIATGLSKHVFSFGEWTLSPFIPLLALIVFTGLDWGVLRNRAWLTGAAILAIVSAGYYFVYLMTPIELSYHLQRSLDRLLLQLWPSFLLISGLLCRRQPQASH